MTWSDPYRSPAFIGILSRLTLKQAPHVVHPLLYVLLHWPIISYSPLSAIQYVYACRLIELYRTLKSRCTTGQCNVKGDVQVIFKRAGPTLLKSSRAERSLFILLTLALQNARYSRSRGLKSSLYHPWPFIHSAQAVR